MFLIVRSALITTRDRLRAPTDLGHRGLSLRYHVGGPHARPLVCCWLHQRAFQSDPSAWHLLRQLPDMVPVHSPWKRGVIPTCPDGNLSVPLPATRAASQGERSRRRQAASSRWV